MKVFILGASGLVGGNCLKHFTEMGWDAVGTYFSFATEGTVFYDTLNPDHKDNFDVKGFNPDVIVHCGALTHVDYCEQNPEESHQKTVVSTNNVIALAKACNAKMVYISTDYVFDGVRGPYREDDEVNPISVYGRHKLEAEQAVLKEIDNALVMRVTNVYGDEIRGKNFIARIIEQCCNKQKLTLKLPYDQYATPSNAWDIAKAMYLLLKDGKTGIYNIGGTDFLNRVELALKVLQFFPDAEYDMIPMSTEALKQPALRPLIGGFVKAKFSSEYPEFLFGSVEGYVRSKI